MTELQRVKLQRAETQLEIELWNVIAKHPMLNFLSIATVLIGMGQSILVRKNYKKGK